MEKIGIIMINYADYAERFLPDCWRSLRKQKADGFSWQLYLIDNASSQESFDFLRAQAPKASILTRSDGNYSAANKMGVEQALRDGCSHVVIANMDVIFADNWLQELLLALNHNSLAGIAQSKILLARSDDQKIINSVGNAMHFLGFGFTKGYGEKDSGQYDEQTEILGYASGCSMIIKSDVFAAIGNYDPEYYMYHDDVEFCWRAKLAGYKIVFAPRSVVYHKYEFSRSIKMLYYMERNRYIVIFSFYRLPTIILILPALVLMDAGMLVYSIIGGWFKIKLSVYRYFFSRAAWRHIVSVRKNIRSGRKISDRQITNNFSGQVLYQEIMNPVLRYFANPLFNLYWLIVKQIIIW